ncbi:hypothetical protein FHS89_002030 [Rubricella aquisinus]|uniref:Uncharacterized protein n=1 Tax=Rubricella aquisinus TaxID=2028108 RepID=A0A840WXW5_9RHOB|nr:hypothetical protein [Rubricella aquisinus]
MTELCIATFHSPGNIVGRFSCELLVRSDLQTIDDQEITKNIGFSPLTSQADPERPSDQFADCFLLDTRWDNAFAGKPRGVVRGGRGFQL